MDHAPYPPAPWRLRGRAYASLFRVEDDAPALAPPAPLRPARLFGRRAVAALFAEYEPGGDLAYRELLMAAPVLAPGGPALHVLWIAVDDPRSAAGGRALWAVPKTLAEFDVAQGADGAIAVEVRAEGEGVARLAIPPRRLPALPVPVFAATAQLRAGEVARARIRASGRLAPARLAWRFEPQGPLGALAGRTPLASARYEDVRLAFG